MMNFLQQCLQLPATLKHASFPDDHKKKKNSTMKILFQKMKIKYALVVMLVSAMLLFSASAFAQNVAGYAYTAYTSVNGGNWNYSGLSNPFTVTYSGTTWTTSTNKAFTAIDKPLGLTNYTVPSSMLELGMFITGPFPVATYTFTSNLTPGTVMFIEDVDAQESFRIEFLDASGNLLNPATLGTYNLSNPARSAATFNSTNLTVTATDNNNYQESLSDFVINSGLIRQVRITQIASPGNLASSGTAEFFFAAPSVGYMYVHKKALNESASIDFPFTVSGGAGTTAVAPFSLNDQAGQLRVKDIGASQNGRLWAIDETTSTLYYRDANSNIWTATSITNVSRVDGGVNGNAVYISTTGTVYSYNGTTATAISTVGAFLGATDIGSAWNGLPYLIKSGIIYQYSGTGTTWNTVSDQSATYLSFAIDANPLTGDAYVAVKNISTNAVSVIEVTAAGVVTNIGTPPGLTASSATFPRDVAVNDKGEVYLSAFKNADGWYVFKYNGSWSAKEDASFDVNSLTGGVGGELWSTMNSGGQGPGQPTVPYYNIFTRATDGTNIFYIDDERVRTTAGNSILIPVIPGTYTITEAASSGWDLQTITVDDPTNNSSADKVSRTATLNIAPGEIVNAIFQNGELNPVAMTNSCSSSYLEDFGTGAVGTFGSLVPGQTSYHFLNNSVRAEDGYCKIVSTAFPDFNTWQVTPFYDHTSGNGTGRMYCVNAGYDLGEFFRRRFTGIKIGATYTFSAWAANLTPGAPIKPNILFQVVDHSSQAVLGTFTTGNINTATSQWNQYGFTFTATNTDIDLLLLNNSVGGSGNDLAIDDISFSMTPPTIPITTVISGGCGTSGSITVTSPLGASYEYSKDNTTWQSSTAFNNLAPGTYTIYARFTGTTGCVVTKTNMVGATICGKIWDDANGNAVNSGENSITSGVWVNLVDPVTHAVLQSVQVDASGNYSFSGLPQNTNYQVILTATDQTGNTNLTSAALPTGYTATGTNLSGAASVANTTAVITVNTGTNGLTVQNFGIEKLPDTDPENTNSKLSFRRRDLSRKNKHCCKWG
ncbi:hypothetical protein [Ferruginibacter sp.]